MKRNQLPMNLQLFADAGEGGQGGTGEGSQPKDGKDGSSGQQGGVSFDYEKLASIISGKQTVTEQTVLKNYFKEQGLSKDEAEEAVRTYKAQKAQREPDVKGLQTELESTKSALQSSLIEKEGYMIGIELGLDPKSVPYILKMADLQDSIGEDGKVKEDKVKEAINKVLEAIPALKPEKPSAGGFMRIGGDGDKGNAPGQNAAVSLAFGNNK